MGLAELAPPTSDVHGIGGTGLGDGFLAEAREVLKDLVTPLGSMGNLNGQTLGHFPVPTGIDPIGQRPPGVLQRGGLLHALVIGGTEFLP